MWHSWPDGVLCVDVVFRVVFRSQLLGRNPFLPVSLGSGDELNVYVWVLLEALWGKERVVHGHTGYEAEASIAHLGSLEIGPYQYTHERWESVFMSVYMPAKSCTGALSWNRTRIPQDSLGNSLISIISESKSLGPASSSIPSAFFIAWDFIINFDKFFLGAFCWGSTEYQCQQRPVNSSKSLSK